MPSRKKAYTLAVAFTPAELTTMWRRAPVAPKTPHQPDPTLLDALLLSRSQICGAIELSLKETDRLLHGQFQGEGIQLRFDAFLGLLQEAFEIKRLEFETNWVSQNPTDAKASQKKAKPAAPKTSTALAIREERPNDLVDPTPIVKELGKRMGYDIFENLSALSRASEVSRSSLKRMRDGAQVLRRSLDRVAALGRLSTRTLVRRMQLAG